VKNNKNRTKNHDKFFYFSQCVLKPEKTTIRGYEEEFHREKNYITTLLACTELMQYLLSPRQTAGL
jgi:hypothetical protein